MLHPGDQLPDFTLLDQDKNPVTSNDLIGRKLVIFFYPKDETAICTIEVCNFRDHLEEFENHDTIIIGISADAPASHKRFAMTYNLKFPLLSDENKEVEKLFGLHRKLFGLLAERVTFIFDKKGVLLKCVSSRWNGKIHVREALREIQNMEQS